MEQLQEVLKYRFWIALGIGIILCLTGWWMTTSGLAATIKTRKDVLKKVEDGIPTESAARAMPNDKWTNALSLINTRQQTLVDAAKLELWERQRQHQFWPSDVQEFADKTPYLGEFDITARVLYRTSYQFDVEKVYDIVRPFKPIDRSGVVIFPKSEFVPFRRRWDNLAPTSMELWESQEDLWLMIPILTAIRDINGGENGERLDAAIYIIQKLALLGGQRGQSAASGQQNMMGAMSSEGDMAASGMMNRAAMGGMQGGSGQGGPGGLGGVAMKPVTADFDPKEEVGDGGTAPWEGMAGNNRGMMLGMEPDASGAADGAMTTGGGAASNYRRYVDDEETLPYKTRAFYLSVVMDHRRVPDLIAELTASGRSDWPIEIVRVQVARINFDDFDGSRTPGGDRGMAFGSAGSGNPGFDGSFGSGGGSGFPGGFPGGSGAFAEPDAGSSGVPGENDPTAIGIASAAPTQPRGTGLELIMTDPNLAKVALCGLIYIYKPVQPPQAETTAPPPTTEDVPAAPMAADPTAAPTEGAPATVSAPAEAVTDPAAEGAAATVPATTVPATPPVTTPPGDAPPAGASPQ